MKSENINVKKLVYHIL